MVNLAAAIYMMSISGTLYAYGAYSSDLRDEHNLSDAESSRIITIANVGFCFAFFVGIVSDIGGAKLCALIGGIIAVCGFVLVRESAKKNISDSWGMFAMEFSLVGQGSTFIYMAALVNYQNFPKKLHGVIIGVLDCMFGFSAAIFTLIYHHVFDSTPPNISGFMTFCAVCTAVASVLGMLFVGVIKKQNEDDIEKPEEDTRLLSLEESPRFGKFRSLASRQFWILFFIFMLGQGVTLQLINNAGDVATAIKPNDSDSLSTNIPLAASIAGGILRVSIGVASDIMSARGMRISTLLVGIIAFVVLAQATLLFIFDDAIMASAVFTGIAFGGQWCIVPILTSAEFGEDVFGVNWGILICASAAGPWLFQPYQAHVYDVNTQGSGSCYGSDCYHDTWIVTLAASGLAFLLAIWFDYNVKHKKNSGSTVQLQRASSFD